MGAIALAAVGLGLGIGGTAMGASSAKKKRAELTQALGSWLPDTGKYQTDWFADMQKFMRPSTELARQTTEATTDISMGARERQLPGFGQASADALASISPLLRGELPKGVMDAFTRAGGASTVGAGFGGSDFGALNTGLFGARGALGGMQTGLGLLQSLVSSMPQVQVTSPTSFLSQIMSPLQRTQTQLSIRGQNMGVASQLAGMDTSNDVWGGFMNNLGGTLMGAGLSGMGGGSGGGFGSFSGTGQTAGGYSGGGVTGGWSGSPWMGAMV
jgi:hypothetical protein